MLDELYELVQRIRKGRVEPCELRVHPDVERIVLDESKLKFGSVPVHNFVNTLDGVPLVSSIHVPREKVFFGFNVEVRHVRKG